VAEIAPPPPPQPQVHKPRKHKKAVAVRPTHKLRSPVLKPAVAAAPVAVAAPGGSSSPALPVLVIGLALALLAVGISFLPVQAVPAAFGFRLERSRQTIVITGLAIGVACALIGLLTALAGR
jgi:hypothetical protein